MSLSVFITGGTAGIGLALAQEFLQLGYNVAICGRDLTKINSLEKNKKLFTYQADVTDRESLKKAIEDFNQKCGLNIIVANAGLSFSKKTQIPDFAQSRKIIDVNLIGALNTFEFALPIFLKQKKGQLVGISSVAALAGFPGVSAYSASKAALATLLEGYVVDLAEFGVKTTCIYPGFVDTPLTQKNHHKMPFLMDANIAAKKITRAIINEKKNFGLPWHFVGALKILSIMPKFIFYFVMKLYNFNYYTENNLKASNEN